MNSFEIEKLLERDKRFLGCFPHDKLPSFPKQFPRSLIINTDDSTRLGDHWVGVILNKDKCFYFDSYGVPILDKNIIDFLINRYSTAIVNDTCIQDTFSNSCGKFTVAFITFVKNQEGYHDFLSIFDTKNLAKNDKKIQKIFENI